MTAKSGTIQTVPTARSEAPPGQRPRVQLNARHEKGRPEAAFPNHALRRDYFTSAAIASPRSPGERTVLTPAASIALNLPSAVPEPPEAIAPA